MAERFVKQTGNGVFDRTGSTVSYMDDFQIAIRTYDGCVKSCTGCVVDSKMREKNNSKDDLIITKEQAQIIQKNVKEMYDYLQEKSNNQDKGYFSKDGRKLNNFSYTYRFGNHAQVPVKLLEEYVNILDCSYNVFSSGAGIVPYNIIELAKKYEEKTFLVEFIYDPLKDDIDKVCEALNESFELNVHGYIEMVLNNEIITAHTPEEFANLYLEKLSKVSRPLQLQLGKYVPNKNRMFNNNLVPSLEDEINWLEQLAKIIVQRKYKIYVLPLGEYAVTLMDDYMHIDHENPKTVIKQDLSYYENEILPTVIDLMKVSIYIDEKLNVYHWSENIGQQVLDKQYNYPPIGNLYDNSLLEILSDKNLKKYHFKNELKLFYNSMCKTCPYVSFCAPHSLDLFRKMIVTDKETKIENCYGYMKVIKAFMNREYLENMIQDFRELDF